MRRLIPGSFLLMALAAAPADAYIGPGAGAGAIAVVLGFIASVFLAFVAILWYPIKRILKKRKARGEKKDNGNKTDSEAQPEE